MRALIQRVSNACIYIDDKQICAINSGLCVFLGVAKGDSQQQADKLAEKISKLRIFSDDHGKMNHSLLDVSGSMLVVSQFTLFANVSKGCRPNFELAAEKKEADSLYRYFCEIIKGLGIPVETGVFAANMDVHLTNAGPVTIYLDEQAKES